MESVRKVKHHENKRNEKKSNAQRDFIRVRHQETHLSRNIRKSLFVLRKTDIKTFCRQRMLKRTRRGANLERKRYFEGTTAPKYRQITRNVL